MNAPQTMPEQRRPAPARHAPVDGRVAPQFWVCALVLASAALLLFMAKQSGWLQLTKKPIALRKAFDVLAKCDLGPYRLVPQPRLTSESEQELGTTDYGIWTLEDTAAAARGSPRLATLFVTYYTGKPDQVPHVPEECLQAAGRQQMGRPASLKMTFDSAKGVREAPVRSMAFSARQVQTILHVFYTFQCNGGFYDTRNDVRVQMADPREKYLYYSKVELTFEMKPGPDAAAQAAAAAQRVFGVILPILEREFWPDWDEVMRRQAAE